MQLLEVVEIYAHNFSIDVCRITTEFYFFLVLSTTDLSILY